MKEISSEEIMHLASLSALEFSEEEAKEFSKEFNNILKFVDKIASAKLEKDDIFASAVLISELREDEVKESYTREEILKNAPKQRKGYFVVPKVVE